MAASAAGSGQRSGVGSTPVALPPAVADAVERVVDVGEGPDGAQLVDEAPDRDARMRPAAGGTTEPAATRGAVERAEARSSTSRMSAVSYLMAPARSAWPGRASVMGLGRLAAGMGSTDIRSGPALPVEVGDVKASGRAERPPEAQARAPRHAVALDLHAPAAAVAVLATGQVAVDLAGGDAQPGRQAVEDAAHARAVGLARGEQPEPVHRAAPARLDGRCR